MACTPQTSGPQLGMIVPPRDSWQRLEAGLLVTPGGEQGCPCIWWVEAGGAAQDHTEHRMAHSEE